MRSQSKQRGRNSIEMQILIQYSEFLITGLFYLFSNFISEILVKNNHWSKSICIYRTSKNEFRENLCATKSCRIYTNPKKVAIKKKASFRRQNVENIIKLNRKTSRALCIKLTTCLEFSIAHTNRVAFGIKIWQAMPGTRDQTEQLRHRIKEIKHLKMAHIKNYHLREFKRNYLACAHR